MQYPELRTTIPDDPNEVAAWAESFDYGIANGMSRRGNVITFCTNARYDLRGHGIFSRIETPGSVVRGGLERLSNEKPICTRRPDWFFFSARHMNLTVICPPSSTKASLYSLD